MTLHHLFWLASLHSMKWMTIHPTLIYHFHLSTNLRTCDSELLEVFTNGLGFNMTSLWRPSTERHYWDSQNKSLIHTWWEVGWSLQTLQCLTIHLAQEMKWSYPPCCWYIHFHNYCFPWARIQVACCLCWML
jgi:hypothetical protein